MLIKHEVVNICRSMTENHSSTTKQDSIVLITIHEIVIVVIVLFKIVFVFI